MAVNILTPCQKKFLQLLGAEPHLRNSFYLTGGTALAGFYLRHRYSEDLDFFSESEIDLPALDVFISRLKKTLAIKKIDFQQAYNRNLFFLHIGDMVLKTEFTYFPFPRIETGSIHNGVRIDSAADIAVNKLFTIYQRVTARDYIDLYLMCKKYKFTIAQLLKLAKAKFDWHIDPIQLGTQFIKAEEAKDYPRMIKELAPSTWHTFFRNQAKKLAPSILSS